tara:strand:+ start:2534 stop:3274 length:741 start_codon:yes stop_codon:yes gene_type:complete
MNMGFKIFPAIDLRGGNCVRLLRGDYSEETVYGMTPVDQALLFQEAGSSWVHIVDLDAALSGDPINYSIIKEIAGVLDIPIQVGGGIRSESEARNMFAVGVERVVIGTVAIENPNVVRKASQYGRVAVGLDVWGDEIATHGWTRRTGVSLVEGMRKYSKDEVDAFIVTQIEQDGTMDGPDLEILRSSLDESNINIVASGGVGSIQDIEDLKKLEASQKFLEGVIIGKAIYEKEFSLFEALKIEGIS